MKVPFDIPTSGKAQALIVLGLLGLVITAAGLGAQEATRAKGDTAGDKDWQAVAPGLVEPRSGEIRIAAPTVARIGEVLVQPNDTVFAGQLLIRLEDEEVRTRFASAEAQVAMRQRARRDQSASGKAAQRRRAEDAEFDAQKAVIAARAALDAATAKKRIGGGSDRDIEAARQSLARIRSELAEQKAERRRVEDDSPLPTANEGQLNIARVELLAADAAIEKLMIRAPIAGTVLQVNARTGELASPSAPRPLVVVADLSAMRVRAELDERDFGDVKVGQPVLVRTTAFGAREFAGKVAWIAPLIEQSRINARGQRNLTDVNVAEVLVDLAEAGPLAAGMKVDVYFRRNHP